MISRLDVLQFETERTIGFGRRACLHVLDRGLRSFQSSDDSKADHWRYCVANGKELGDSHLHRLSCARDIGQGY